MNESIFFFSHFIFKSYSLFHVASDSMSQKRNVKSIGTKNRRISYPVQTPSTELIDTPNHNDILLGRGGHNNKFIGNERLRDFAMDYVIEYMESTKAKKTHLAEELVTRIRSLDPPGRFLKKIESGHWIDIGDDLARDKASQVLRDAVRDIPEYEEIRKNKLMKALTQKKPSGPRENPSTQDILRFSVGSSASMAQEHNNPPFIPTLPTSVPHPNTLPQDGTIKKRPHSEILGDTHGFEQSKCAVKNANSKFGYTPMHNLLNEQVSSPSLVKSNTFQTKPSPAGAKSNLMPALHEPVPFRLPSDPNLYNYLHQFPTSSEANKHNTTFDQSVLNNNPQYKSQARNTGLLQMRLESLRQRYLHEIKSEISSYQKFGAIPPPNLVTSVGHPEAFHKYLQAHHQQYHMLQEQIQLNNKYVPKNAPSQMGQTSEVPMMNSEQILRKAPGNRRTLPLNDRYDLKRTSNPPSAPETVLENSGTNALLERSDDKKTQSDDSRLKLLCATLECVEKI